jgi:acyl-CoA thioester hydrolase
MPSRYRLKRRVLFYETDAAGIVHFSWFFRYMEEAEHALWREAGLSIAPQGAPVGFPRVSASFDFRRPLYFEDQFEVAIEVVEITAKAIRYTATVTRDQTEIGIGSMTAVCVSKSQGGQIKAVKIPREIADCFQVAD